MSLFSGVPWKLMLKFGPAAVRFAQAAWQMAGVSDPEISLPMLSERLSIAEAQIKRIQKDVKTVMILLALAGIIALCGLIVGILALIK